ncbi:MAG: hypothetical protein JSW55_07295 [Chloroflexota bacterium]|nr:MAG: hypothetical protein JSW55_07295 [Chloroflexota bacterium]
MAEAQHAGRRQNRPLGVTLVILGVLLFGLTNGWRALGLVRQSSLLLELGAKPDPRVCAAVAAIWAILFAGLAFATWRGRRFVRLAVPLAILAFGSLQIALPGLCAQPAQSQDGWLVMAIIYAMASLLSALALNAGPGRAYFDERLAQDTE